MVEPLRGCTPKDIPSGGLLLIPCLIAYTSNYVRPVHSRRQHVTRSDGTYRIERGNCTRYGRDHFQFKYTKPFTVVLASTNCKFFAASVLFTDEASFSREGIFNTHNSHSWAAANPHVTRTRAAQDRFLVNVWAGILGDYLTGPYILPDRLTGSHYLIFLKQVLPELLDSAHVTAATRTSMWFQQDGAPAHFSISVRNHFDATCGERWIGRGGPVHWPPRSPDLSCLDYFFWGQMKSLVYEKPVNSAEELVARISAAAREIRNTPEMLSNVRRSMK
ncbi:uncharacterized protein TNCV_2907381 [Trichonephila clavipes]|nr:uncharacterized protein TNCV_2907381 [Trichonephila clavipes]